MGVFTCIVHPLREQLHCNENDRDNPLTAGSDIRLNCSSSSQQIDSIEDILLFQAMGESTSDDDDEQVPDQDETMMESENYDDQAFRREILAAWLNV